jgi:hypothetical protein
MLYRYVSGSSEDKETFVQFIEAAQHVFEAGLRNFRQEKQDLADHIESGSRIEITCEIPTMHVTATLVLPTGLRHELFSAVPEARPQTGHGPQ